MYNFIYTRFDGEFWEDNRAKRRRGDRHDGLPSCWKKIQRVPVLMRWLDAECNPACFCELTPDLVEFL